jgi:hypothetical protein
MMMVAAVVMGMGNEKRTATKTEKASKQAR